MSSVFVSESIIEKNRVAIVVYSKKSYFPESKIEFDKSVMFFGNRIKVITEGDQSSAVNRSKNKSLPIINISIIIDNANIWFSPVNAKQTFNNPRKRKGAVYQWLTDRVIFFVCLNIRSNSYI